MKAAEGGQGPPSARPKTVDFSTQSGILMQFQPYVARLRKGKQPKQKIRSGSLF
jgi:hypothetical protein